MAQDEEPRKKHPYLGLTVGLAFMKVKDELVMPVRYTGTNFNFKLNYWRRNPQSIQEIYISGVVGAISTKDFLLDNFGARFIEPRSQLYWGEIGYMYLHKVSSISSDKYQIYMGGNFFLLGNVRFNQRWDNSAINYEAAITPLSYTARVERSILTKKKEKKLTFSYSLNFPILSIVLRPPFSGVPDFLDHESSQLYGSASVVSFWDFPRFKSTLDMTIPLSQNNLMKFTYIWDYYSFQQPVNTRYTGHFFQFTILTHL